MRIIFDSEDDSNVYIEVEINPYIFILSSISNTEGSRGYVPEDLKQAVNDLLEIYPNDSLRTIINERVEVKFYELN